MKNIVLCETAAEYNEYINDCPIRPVVAKCKSDGKIRIAGGEPENALRFTAIEDNTSVGYLYNGEIPITIYIYENNIWKLWDGRPVSLNAGESIYVKGYNPYGLCPDGYATSDNMKFTGTGKYICDGNILSLIDEDFDDALPDAAFWSLFKENESIVVAPKLLNNKLSDLCYAHMFEGCTSLTAAPALPATALASRCYDHMFYGCTSLTAAPALPATTLARFCYDYMFYNCTALTTAPELPATTLEYSCYDYMFYGCTKLNHIKAMFTTTPSSTYTSNWLSGVASTGTFVANRDADWIETIGRGSSTIPEGWNVTTE